MAYAQGTAVPVDRSKAEIERLLTKYGATGFMSGWMSARAMIAFEMRKRGIKMFLPLPDPKDPKFWKDRRSSYRRSSDSAAAARYEQELRRRWRSLALVVKAKLEAVETGVVSFEEEWLPHFVMPDGRTFAEHALPAIARAYETGAVPALLPDLRGDR